MRVTLIQMNSRTAARDENVERACGFIGRAAQAGADLIVLPEFFNNEYFPQYRDYRYMDYAETDDGYTQSRVKEQARRHGLYILSTIFEMERPGLYYDTAIQSNHSLSSLVQLADVGHIVYGSDWPWYPESGVLGTNKELEASRFVSDEDRAAIYRTNALRLLPRMSSVT